MDNELLIKLADEASIYGLEVTNRHRDLFNLYAEFLKEYNKKVNLTSIIKDKDIIEKHFLDSIILCRYIKNDFGYKVIDVGSGAGFPGVPIKIIRNDINICLVDSIGKKTEFLKQLSEYLNLDYEVVNARAEMLGQNKIYREKYDLVVARAVKNLRELSEYCLPLINLNGYFIALKGPNISCELNEALEAIKVLGGAVSKIDEYRLPCNDKRMIVIIKKISQTPSKYPRQSSKISKKPI